VAGPEGRATIIKIIKELVPEWDEGLHMWQLDFVVRILDGEDILCCTAMGDGKSALFQPKDYPQILWVFMIVEDLYFSPFGSHYQWSQDYHSLPNNRYGVPYLHLGLAYATRGGR
jgi:hypothetical protein